MAKYFKYVAKLKFIYSGKATKKLNQSPNFICNYILESSKKVGVGVLWGLLRIYELYKYQ